MFRVEMSSSHMEYTLHLPADRPVNQISPFTVLSQPVLIKIFITVGIILLRWTLTPIWQAASGEPEHVDKSLGLWKNTLPCTMTDTARSSFHRTRKWSFWPASISLKTNRRVAVIVTEMI